MTHFNYLSGLQLSFTEESFEDNSNALSEKSNNNASALSTH